MASGLINYRRLKMGNERIVSSAVEYIYHRGDGEERVLIVGARHFDPLMQPQIRRMWRLYGRDTHSDVCQGFITNRFRFVGRVEAKVIAEKEGQLEWLKQEISKMVAERSNYVGEDRYAELSMRIGSLQSLLTSNELFSEALY